MLCVNISVGNQFDFASSRTNYLMIGLIPGKLINQPVDRQCPKLLSLALSVTANELSLPHVAS